MMLDRMDLKLAAYGRLVESTAFYLPANGPEIRALLAEAKAIRQAEAESQDVGRARLLRFDRIGNELVAWAEVMVLFDRLKS